MNKNISEKIIIRPETKDDYYNADHMTQKAFWNLHFPGCNEHYLLHVLRQHEDYVEELSRVAEIDGKIVGGIYYSKSYILGNDRQTDILTFGPLCVDPEYQNMGVGGRLLEETIQLAREKGFCGIVIFGEPGYYPKHGFKTCDNYGITTIDGKNFDAFMGYEIVPDAFAGIQGSFHESPVFEGLADEDAEAYNKNFPYMEKLKLPGQWE